jgi:hypothetical protein
MNLIANKYAKWYYAIIDKALSEKRKKFRSDIHYDRHHIVPTSLGGSNDISNKVWLTPKEHFICHTLLVKCTTGKDKMRMACAWHRMATAKRYTSKQYEVLRKQHALIMSGENNPFFGKSHSEETKEKIRKANTGKSYNVGAYRSPEQRAKISKSLKGRKRPDLSIAFKGKKLSDKTKRKIGDARKGKKFAPEVKEKIRQAAIAQWARYHANGNIHIKGAINVWHS